MAFMREGSTSESCNTRCCPRCLAAKRQRISTGRQVDGGQRMNPLEIGTERWVLKRLDWPTSYSLPAHEHEGAQIFAMHRGLISVDTSEQRWWMPRGRVGWIPPWHVHSARTFG